MQDNSSLSPEVGKPRNMPRRLRSGLWLLAFASLLVWAEQSLSIEFLEYLAEFETADGEWIDPEELALMADAGSEIEAEEVRDDQ